MWPFRKPSPRDDFSAYTAGTSVVRETRWSREYRNVDHIGRFLDSRFRDGSASITVEQFTHDWPDWSQQEKRDFCQSFTHYQGRHRAAILRFIIGNGDHEAWSMIAAPVAITLRPSESLPFLSACCKTCDVGKGANYFSALWLTRSPEAMPILWRCLDYIWDSPNLLQPDSVCNFAAFDAIWCINALVRLGEPLGSLRDRYEQLKAHPTMHESVVRWLSEHFDEKGS